MSDKKEHQQVDTSTNAKMDKKDEPGLPVKIPLSIVRWLAYSLLFTIVLIPAMYELSIWWTVSPSLILGHFASQLNAIIKK